jgi:isoaspartyl peptidase/L-asparaginase-like protein (Ntn-hydrolase superfamily)
MPIPACIATWPFGRAAVQTAMTLLQKGRPALEAAIAGAQTAEDDPKNHSVGFAGLPDSLGTVTLDACVMDGRTLNCGAVAAVENVKNVAALARRVMETTPHIMLAGEGAKIFALRNGVTLQCLHTPQSLAEWEKGRAKQKPLPAPPANPPGPGGVPVHAPVPNQVWEPARESHDTISVLALDQKNSLGGCCTTSGLANKMPGRVGDSPIIGAGLYVDDKAGAAGATGVGEEIWRISGSFLIVEAMRGGRSPQEACEVAVRRINEVAVRRGVHPPSAAFIALDPKGRYGAAATVQTNFQYAVLENGKVDVLKARELGVKD